MIVQAGREKVAQLLKDAITHIAVGTDDTPVGGDDTQLGAEVFRAPPSASFLIGSKFQLRSFFPNANLPSTLEEVGWFIEGSGTANSGELLNRELVEFTKNNSDLQVILEIEVRSS